MEIQQIDSLKKRIRRAGWAVMSIGYLYLLLFILGLIGMISVISFFFNFIADNMGGLVLLSLGFLIPPLIGYLIMVVTLVVLGKRIVHIQKGVMWKAGEIKMDPNIRQYFLIVACLSGFLFAMHLFSGNALSLDAILAAILFVFGVVGLMSSKQLFALPEVANQLETPTYKTTPTFWRNMVIVAIVLHMLPIILGLIFRNQIETTEPDLQLQLEAPTSTIEQ